MTSRTYGALLHTAPQPHYQNRYEKKNKECQAFVRFHVMNLVCFVTSQATRRETKRHQFKQLTIVLRRQIVHSRFSQQDTCRRRRVTEMRQLRCPERILIRAEHRLAALRPLLDRELKKPSLSLSPQADAHSICKEKRVMSKGACTVHDSTER